MLYHYVQCSSNCAVQVTPHKSQCMFVDDYDDIEEKNYRNSMIDDANAIQMLIVVNGTMKM